MPHSSLAQLAHRPWPLPRSPWALQMQWRDLLFLHWPLAPALLRAHLPAALELDTFEGQAWLGVVPFCMAGVRGRALPPLPTAQAFPELNLRTYVRQGAHQGVWFFSLDAGSKLAVRGARTLFRLPYFDAQMRSTRVGEQVAYRSQRAQRGAPPAQLALRWQPGDCFERSQPGSLLHWLTERYCMFTPARGGGVRLAHIHHAPWELAPAQIELAQCDMTRILGLELDGSPPLQHAAADQQVLAWLPGWE